MYMCVHIYIYISAAHCFWNEAYGRTMDKDNFRIAAGKYYRDWNIKDYEVQERQVWEFMLCLEITAVCFYEP